MPRVVLGRRQMDTLMTALEWYSSDRHESAKASLQAYDIACDLREARNAERLWKKLRLILKTT